MTQPTNPPATTLSAVILSMPGRVMVRHKRAGKPRPPDAVASPPIFVWSLIKTRRAINGAAWNNARSFGFAMKRTINKILEIKMTHVRGKKEIDSKLTPLEEDLIILRRVQDHIDSDPGSSAAVDSDPEATVLAAAAAREESTLRQLEKELEAEIEASHNVAVDWSRALAPLLQGDDPNAVKGVFEQFVSWVDNNREGKGSSDNPHVSKLRL